MFAVADVAALLFALFLNQEYKRYCFECEVCNVADAKSQNKDACLRNVGERPCADGDKVQEEGADGEPEEVLDEGARVFVETFNNNVVLYASNDGKVEGYKRHDGLEYILGKPQGAECGQYEHDGQDDEGNVVLFHFFIPQSIIIQII